jgi:hypothetical protein
MSPEARALASWLKTRLAVKDIEREALQAAFSVSHDAKPTIKPDKTVQPPEPHAAAPEITTAPTFEPPVLDRELEATSARPLLVLPARHRKLLLAGLIHRRA